MKKFIILSLVFAIGVNFYVSSSVGSAEAANASEFKAGRIIDDAIMYDKNSMSPEQIQAFLDTQLASVGGCLPNAPEDTGNWRDIGPLYVCLREYRENPNVPIRDCTQAEVQAHFGFGPGDSRYSTALSYCWWKDGRANIKGQNVDNSSSQSAARIIWQAAQDYTINPKSLLVMLQKEQGLITDRFPWVGNFGKAMGYACFDGENECRPQYRGFYQQVRSAAWQIRQYAINPGGFNYIAGQTQNIKYHPNSACGTKSVFIENLATAGLYNYTPYTPNQAALNNLYGTGDGCSSYGNRNFWRMFTDWFGIPNWNYANDTPLVGDWDGDGQETVGFRRENRYYLDNDNDGDADWQFGFGLNSDQHLIGDWDGDGSDEIGLKRGERYYFSFDFNGTAERYQGFGNPTDQALVGDWNGDGRDTIGLKRGERYYFNFDFDGKAEIYVGFGNPTDQAFVGDWDGDGDDNIAIKRAERYVFDFGHDGKSDVDIRYGSSFHRVIVGDWDGDGRDEMGLKNGEFYYLDNNLDGKTEIYTGIGIKTDQGIIGDWNGNGRHSIGIKRQNRFFLDNNYDGRAEYVFSYSY